MLDSATKLTSEIQEGIDIMDTLLFTPREQLTAEQLRLECIKVSPIFEKLEQMQGEIVALLKQKKGK